MANILTISILSSGRDRHQHRSPFHFNVNKSSNYIYYTDQAPLMVSNGVPLTTITGSGGSLGGSSNPHVGTSHSVTLKGGSETIITGGTTTDNHSNANDYYTGCIMKVEITPGEEESSVIVKYDGLTKACTFEHPFISRWN